MFSIVAFVSELPKLTVAAGFATIVYVTGEQVRTVAMPIWLLRIWYKRIGDALDQLDSETRAA